MRVELSIPTTRGQYLSSINRDVIIKDDDDDFESDLVFS